MECRQMCFVFALLATARSALLNDVNKYALLMPNVRPFRDELYLCTPVKVVPEKNFYIVGFEPNASMHTVHHILLFGCSHPGTEEPLWDCGEMSSSIEESTLRRANPCAMGSNVIYAWARNADALTLPDGVGFQVGNGTQINYLVLQVHYVKQLPPDAVDNSGVNLIYTERPQSKLAGVVLLATGGVIPPHSITHMESDCKIEEDKVIYPFAYRAHTHSLGKVVSGYQVQTNELGEEQWTLLGKRNPLTAQMFYPTLSRAPIRRGDTLAARCTMESNRDRSTHIGPTSADEMCNFYLMYYVEDTSALEMKYCFTEGPPYHFWHTQNNLRNIPEDASSI